MAGSKKSSFRDAILNHIFMNLDIANIGDAAGLQNSATEGSLYMALYSVAPTDTSQGTEAVYTNYARVGIPRNSTYWQVSGNVVAILSNVTFPTCGATGGTLVAFAICTGGTAGVNDQIYWGDLASSLVITNGNYPFFDATDLTALYIYEN